MHQRGTRRRQWNWRRVLSGTFFLLLVAFLLGIPIRLDLLRGWLERRASQSSCRDVVVAGPLRLVLSPRMSLTLSDVTIGPSPELGDPNPFLRVRTARVGVRLAPLLHRRIELTDVALAGGEIRWVRRQADTEGHPESGPPGRMPGILSA